MLSATQLKQYRSGMQRTPNPFELRFIDRLERAQIPFKHQVIIGFYIADIVIPSKLLVIEIDGASHKRQKEYDAKRDEFIKRCGFSIIRIPEPKVLLFDLNTIKELPDFPKEAFSNACWRGVSLKGSELTKARKEQLEREIRKATSPLF